MYIVFHPYLTTDSVHYAAEITQDMQIKKIGKRTSILNFMGLKSLRFNHAIKPQIGDFIIYITADDVYHCPKEDFLEHHTLGICPTTEPIKW
ncbi:hypothetical protein [Vibrio atlanticus]|jgi:hypothetical protein|uniref:hypothetical protein n=1 Tax=Vibrio atlanticus TaxID=693153 RepID=UPI002A70A0CA|nr:conserved hypothetical protein [Vibrio crassostreae]